jgi:hypothetical protein
MYTVEMFYRAKEFNQPLDTWILSSITDWRGMFALMGCCYEPRLQSWEKYTKYGSANKLKDLFVNKPFGGTGR